MKTLTTPKGTALPLTNLKGKDYLMVAYRIQWMNEVHPNFEISTDFPLVTDEQTIARAKVTLMDLEGKVIKTATATKRETKKDFSDHTEKAETAAIGRCLALLGFGTQFALADLDEGDRIVDSPVTSTKNTEMVTTKTSTTQTSTSVEASDSTKKSASFRKPKLKAEVSAQEESEWT